MMSDFDKRFEEHDKQFDRMRKAAMWLIPVQIASVLGLFGFGIWVVVKLMQHFGVI